MNLNLNEQSRRMVAAEERAKIDRNVIIWLNTFPDRPVDVTTQGQLGNNVTGLGVSSITSAYINRSFILGGYEAEYTFTLICRVKPDGSPDKSLQANEFLNRIGDWAARNKPNLGNEIRVRKVEPTSIAETYAQYADGDEDHHITIKIIYEVTE